MSSKYSTFEVRQGDTFYEILILDDTVSGVAVNLVNVSIEAVLVLDEPISLDVVIMSATDGRFSIGKSADNTAKWPVGDIDAYITIIEGNVRTSTDNFTINVIEGVIDD